MARKCKCFVTGEEGTTDTFYKLGTRYFKSREIAEEYEFQNSCRKEVIDIMANIIQYEKGQKFPTVLTKSLKELSDFYKWSVVLSTVKMLQSRMELAILTKNFTSEYTKIAYLTAMLRNNINDIDKNVTLQTNIKRAIDKTTIDSALHDLDYNNIGTNKKHNDISKFLEDETWN